MAKQRFSPWRWAHVRRLTALAFLALIAYGGIAEPGWFRGTTAATTLFGIVPLVDPLAALEVTLASRELQTSLLIGAGLLLAAAVLMGPLFCGWVCPLGLVLDLNDALRRRVRRALGRRRAMLPEWQAPRGLRRFALGLFLGLALILQVPVFQTLSPIHAIAWAVSLTAGPGLILVAVLLLVEWAAPRLWCRSLCPLGAVYSFVGRRSPFAVQIDPLKAGQTPCMMCTLHCPMGIRVMEDYSLQGAAKVDDPACSRCGACIDACPSGVLRLGFRQPRAKVATPESAPAKRRRIERPRSRGRHAAQSLCGSETKDSRMQAEDRR